MLSTVNVLRVFRKESPVNVLGPYSRAVIWVQGCTLACPNCIVPESWRRDGGDAVPVETLAQWVNAQPSIEGITISGGEPMLQAGALCQLIDQARAKRNIGVMCFTGCTHEALVSNGTDDQIELLKRIDLLIDGAYIEERHKSLLWRGSDNQRLLQLSDRYASYISAIHKDKGDVSVGIEVVIDADGGIGYAGVPPKPGFRKNFISGMNSRGIRLALQAKPRDA